MQIKLIDGERLAGLMIENNIGVSVEKTYYVRQIDSDYFDN
jgi:restriction system protein